MLTALANNRNKRVGEPQARADDLTRAGSSGAIEEAVAQSAEVLPLRHHPDELASHTAAIPGPVTHVTIEGGRHELANADPRIVAAVAEWLATL